MANYFVNQFLCNYVLGFGEILHHYCRLLYIRVIAFVETTGFLTLCPLKPCFYNALEGVVLQYGKRQCIDPVYAIKPRDASL